MLTITISSPSTRNSEDNIHISGTRDIVLKLKAQLRENIWMHDQQEYIQITALPPVNGLFKSIQEEYASFAFQLYNLKKIIVPENCVVADLLLSFIETTADVSINREDLFLLQYWAYEANKIRMKQSYRSTLIIYSLTCSATIQKILETLGEPPNDLNNFYPTPEQLFSFLENSDQMKEMRSYYQPQLPYVYEMNAFANKLKIQQIATLLNEIATDTKSCNLLQKLPSETLLHIASYCIESRTKTHHAPILPQVSRGFFTTMFLENISQQVAKKLTQTSYAHRIHYPSAAQCDDVTDSQQESKRRYKY